MFSVFCFTSYASENKHFFIGQTGSGESVRTAFILEVTADNFLDHMQITENGEVFLKADQVLAIPKETLSNLVSFAQRTQGLQSEASPQLTSAYSSEAMSNDFELDWRCPNPTCKIMNKAFDKYCRKCGTAKP